MIWCLNALRGCSLRILFYLAIFWLGGHCIATAQTTRQKPTITAGPPNLITASRGDVLKFKIEYKADKNLVQQVKWLLRSQSMICRDVTCTLRTSAIAPGEHAIYVVVFDDSGSDSVKFDIKINDPVRGKSPREIMVPMGPVSADQKTYQAGVSAAGFFAGHSVTVIQGRAYVHNRSLVTVIGQETEAIGPADSLRTGSPGLARMALTGSDETWLLDGSMARLRGKDGGRGVLRLERGTVRSRTLNNVDAPWDLAAGGFVFRGEAKRDILVQRLPGDEILVTALRGRVRIHNEASFKGKADEEAFFKITPGTTVRLKITTSATGEDFARPESGDTPAEQEAVAAIIRTTTPHYLVKRDAADPTKPPFIKNRLPVSLDEGIKAAKMALNEGDPWLAIEPLLHRLDEASKNQEACYLIGRSYVEMLLFPEGEEWLQKALVESQPSKPTTTASQSALDDTKIMLGILNFKRKSWAEAARHFNSADLARWLKDKDLGGERSFMIGKSCALGENRHCAKTHLPRASKEGSAPELKEEAKLLLRKLDLLPGSTWYAKIKSGYNSNIFGLEKPGDEIALPEGVSHNQSGTWMVAAGLDTRGSASDELQQNDQNQFGVEFKLNIEKAGFTSADLGDYGISTYSGQAGVFYTRASRSGIEKNSSRYAPIMDLGVHAYLLMGGVGSQRIHDEGGGGLQLTFPGFLGFELGVRAGRVVDPQPNFDHGIDYLTGETSASADDTAQISRIALKLIPYGPSSLAGEPRGTTHASFAVENINTTREEFPNGTGPVQMLNSKIAVATKVLEPAILAFHTGADIITRNISSSDAETLKVPIKQTKIKIGLDYEHDLNPFITFDLSASLAIATSAPSSLASSIPFNRSLFSLGVRVDL